MAEKNEYKSISKKLLFKSWLHWQFYNHLCTGYDRKYVNGWTCGCLPALQYLYKDKPEDFKDSLVRTRDYYMCEQTFGTIIFGIYLSMEEQYANGADIEPNMIRQVKSSLMGPLSGIGDSIMGGTIRQILLVLFLSYALEGAIWAFPAWWIIYIGCISMPLFMIFLNSGYKYGKEAVSKLLGTPWLKVITSAAGVASMAIMGGMAAKYTSFSLNYSWSVGETVYQLQDKLDAACPGLLVLVVLFIYYALVGKKINYIWLIVGTWIVCALLAIIGIV